MGGQEAGRVTRAGMRSLVAKSSLGSARAVRLRKSTPRRVRDSIVTRSQTLRETSNHST